MESELQIVFLSFPGCPNAVATRETLRQALAELGLGEAPVTEFDVTSDECPEEHRNWPSPTILINGRDIEGFGPAEASACRIYPGLHGIPSLESVKNALLAVVSEPAPL